MNLAGGGFQDRLLEVKRSQLGPALGVNQPTVDKLLAIEAQYKPLRHQMITGMRTICSVCSSLWASPPLPDQEIKAVLSNLKQKRLEMLNLQQRKDDEEVALLTPLQQARYLIYLMFLIQEARSIKSGTRRARRTKPARFRGRTRRYGWTRGHGGASLSAYRDPGLPSASVRLNRRAAILRRLLRKNSEKPASNPESCGSAAGFFICLLAKSS